MSDVLLELTEESFNTEVLQADKPVLVDFWAEWCGPCKMMSPLLEAVAEDENYAQKLSIVKFNIDQGSELSAKYGVRAIPTLLLFKDGNVAATKVGSLTKGQLTAFIDENL